MNALQSIESMVSMMNVSTILIDRYLPIYIDHLLSFYDFWAPNKKKINLGTVNPRLTSLIRIHATSLNEIRFPIETHIIKINSFLDLGKNKKIFERFIFSF